MNPIAALAFKDIRLLFRDRVAFFFAFLFPLVIAVFFGVIFSGGSDSGSAIPVLVVDEDATTGSLAFIDELRTGGELAVAQASTGDPPPTREEAVDLVRAGKFTAVIVVPAGFGAAREQPFWSPGGEGGMKLLIGLDPSRRAEGGMLTGILTKYGFSQLQAAFASPRKMREQLNASRAALERDNQTNALIRAAGSRFFDSLDAFMAVVPEPQQPDPANPGAPSPATATGWNPFTIESLPIVRERLGPTNTFAVTFPQGIIWAVLGCTLGFAISLAEERAAGTLMRLRVAPLAHWQVLASKALACFFVAVAVCTVLLLIAAAPPFRVRPISIPLVALGIASTAACFVGIMMLLAATSRSQRGGSGLGWGVLLVMAMLGGGMIPLFIMPGWMQTVSVISPVKWAILAIEGGLWRGTTLPQMIIPCGILVGIGTACFALGTAIFDRAQR